MFLHDLPRPLISGSKIYLNPTLRAPLGVVPGSQLYAAARVDPIRSTRELILTPYPYEIWPDIWNLELQLVDAPGQLERLLKILEDLSITVLHYVARTAYNSRYHSKYLMLDCSAYDMSEVDKRPPYRHKEPKNRLSGLYYNIAIEFMHEMRINYDDSPRIRLYRNTLHLNMWEDISQTIPDNKDPILDMPETLIYTKNGLSISNRLIERLRINKTAYCVASVNVKSHAIYCTFHSINDSKIIHIVVYFQPTKVSHTKIMSTLRELNLNIVRSQLARGTLGVPRDSPSWLHSASGFLTLNLLADSKVPLVKEELLQRLNRYNFNSEVEQEAFYAHLLNPMRIRSKEHSRRWPIGSKM